MLRETGLMETGTLYDIHNIFAVHHGQPGVAARTSSLPVTPTTSSRTTKSSSSTSSTGRMMEGRRYSEGLHQALEAKENVTVQNENQTLASITFQNYFRLYPSSPA